MTAIKHRESYIIDISAVQHFAEALQVLEDELSELRFKMVEPGSSLSVNVGDLVFSPAILNRLKNVVATQGYSIETLYAKAPQTQQSALSEGYLVRNEPDFTPQPAKPYASQSSVALPFENKLDEKMQATQKSQLEALSSKWSDQIEALFQKVDHIKDDLPQVTNPSVPMTEPSQDAPLSMAVNSLPTSEESVKTEPVAVEKPKHTQAPPNSNSPLENIQRNVHSRMDTLEHMTQPMSVMVSDKVGEALPQPQAEITETVLYRHSLRSGQVLKTAGNVVIVGDVHAGAEVIAGGDILIWGTLSGNAWAGAPIEGLTARSYFTIRSFKMEPLQLRIGALMARRPDRLFKEDFQVLNSSSQAGSLLPRVEVARVVNQEIQIFEDQLHAL